MVRSLGGGGKSRKGMSEKMKRSHQVPGIWRKSQQVSSGGLDVGEAGEL